MGFCSREIVEQEKKQTIDRVKPMMCTRTTQSKEHNRYSLRLSFTWVLMILAVLACTSYGQFIVQPMVVEETLRPGKRYTQELLLQNWSKDRTHTVDVYIVDMTQNEDSTWLPIREGEDGSYLNPNIDPAELNSCKDWIDFGKQTYTLPPSQMSTVKFDMRVPIKAKGFYCAAVVASLVPREEEDGVAIRFELIVPLLFPIQGYNIPPKVSLKDVGLEYQPIRQFEQGTDSSYVTLNVDNDGGTYSRINGFAQVRMRMSDDNWRLIASNLRFEEVPIIPGSQLKLRHNIGRVLPNGSYKVTGALFVDGRRVKGVEKDIPYVGSATAKTIMEEIVLQTDPELLTIESQPGRFRSENIQILNQSAQPLKVKAYVSDISDLNGRILAGNVLGDKLSCAEWVQVRPSEFNLRDFGKKSLRLTSRMPSIEHRSFYANLKIVATNADGALAGRETVRLIVQNDKIEANYLVNGIDLSLRNMSEARHLVTARYENLGTEYILPDVRAHVVRENRTDVLVTTELVNEGTSSQMMLPIESRSFTSVMDFSTVDYGNYILIADCYYGPTQFKRLEKPIIVYDENGTKMARLNPYATAAAF